MSPGTPSGPSHTEQDPLIRFVSHAQNFEDVVLWRALGHVEEGVYVDVGAQSPSIDSVSLAFHERGWRGVHVEPIDRYANELAIARPGDRVIRAVVGHVAPSVPFYDVPDTGLSTTREDIAARHREDFQVRRLDVPSWSLDSVLDAAPAGDIHWLKIDVEGAERDVLESWGPWGRRPWVVVVESTSPLERTATEGDWEHLLRARDYEMVLFDGLNRFYLAREHGELRRAFASGANVFDDFALSGQASEPFTRLLKSRLEKAGAERTSGQEAIAQLREVIATMTADKRARHLELIDARRAAVRAAAERDAWRRELDAVYASSSWRVTAPLRGIRLAAEGGRLRPRRVLRGVVVRVMRRVVGQPAVKAFGLRILARFPGVRSRLRGLAERAGLVAAAQGPGAAARATAPHLSNGALSPKAARVFDELVAAIRERNH